VPALIEAWPRATKAEQRCFELLRQAYVNARYSPQYTITREQLEWLAARLERLQSLVRDACEQRLTVLAEHV
jgi:predicted transcriptional regulator